MFRLLSGIQIATINTNGIKTSKSAFIKYIKLIQGK